MKVNGNFFIIELRLSICLYILLKRVARGGAVLTLAGSIGLKKNWMYIFDKFINSTFIIEFFHDLAPTSLIF